MFDIYYILFYLLSIDLKVSPIYILSSLYIFSFVKIKNIIFNKKSFADLSIIFICLATLISIFVAILNGNSILFILKNAGGLLVLPTYFIIKNNIKNKPDYFLKIILRVFLFISLISIIYLGFSFVFGQSNELTLFIRGLLGHGKRSGYMDTRFYALSVISSSFPTGLLLITCPKAYYNLVFENKKINKNKLLYLKLLGLLILLTGILLTFSGVTLILLGIIIIPIIYKIIKYILSGKFIVKKSFLLFFLNSFLLVLSLILFIKNMDKFVNFDQIKSLFQISVIYEIDLIDPRIEQINYILKEGNFSIFGRGLGATFYGTNILRSFDSPYGIEMSYINVLDKFGLFSLLFLPYIILVLKNYKYCFSQLKDKEIDIYKLSFLFSNAYLIFALGNPLIFSLQLNFLSMIFLALLSSKTDKRL